MPILAGRSDGQSRSFKTLTEQEVLALAVSLEEEDSRIYDSIAGRFRKTSPATADVFERMRIEESNHRHRLIELHKEKFGENMPLIRRQDVRGFVRRRAVWLARSLDVDAVRKLAGSMEAETRRFYLKAAARTTDASIRQLLGDLAEEERGHEAAADTLVENRLTPGVVDDEAANRRKLFLLQIVQPGLAGLMDGSVSTLAPLFAAAFATANSFETFRVGLAASLGAGISMGFAEALSDDGTLTGRGHPWIRGVACGLMTTLGGIGHTLPYLIPNVQTATRIAIGVVLVELAAISWIRKRYMDTPLLAATIQVVLGGVLVFITGMLIGKAG